MTPWAIAAGDFTPLGGMDRANHALARYLGRSGRTVHLIAHRVWPDVAQLPNVTVHAVRRPFGSHLLGAPLLARAASAVARRIESTATLLSNGGNTRWHGAATWIHYLHAAYEPEGAGSARARIIRSLARTRDLARERETVVASNLIICNSQRTAEDVRRHYGVDHQRLRVIYYGIDAAEFGPVSEEGRAEARRTLAIDAGRLVAMFVGALGDRRKGFDVLFEAWRVLCTNAAWDVDLVVLGSGREVTAWQRRTRTAGLDKRMRFFGFRRDVARLLAAADVLVHPSRYEAYGLGVHEAVCRGLPVIVSASAGVIERLPTEFGSLALRDPLSSHDVVSRFTRWREDRDEWSERAAMAGECLRKRTWDDMAAEIVDAAEPA